MTDITKCAARDAPCSIKDQCWRYTAPSGERQAWNDFSVEIDMTPNKICTWFIKDARVK